jgi:hypothetical protein
MVSDDDPRLRAARYKEGIGTDTGAALMHGTAAEAADGSGDETQGQPRLLNADVEVVARTAIDKAIAQGHFDHLAYAGKPLPDIVASDDPDWWTKSLMRREEVHATEGLGPEALLLRVADAELDDQLDALPTEAEVRNAVDGFNRRVIEASPGRGTWMHRCRPGAPDARHARKPRPAVGHKSHEPSRASGAGGTAPVDEQQPSTLHAVSNKYVGST